MNQIPIRINRNTSDPNIGQITFQILPIQKKRYFSNNNQNNRQSLQRIPLSKQYQRRHTTLDPQKMKPQNRYRRISSCDGSRKFPKDFFNLNDLPKAPIKLRYSSSNKKQNQTISLLTNTQNKMNLMNSSSNQFIHKRKQYKLQSPQKNLQPQKNPSQVQTPKFNHKFFEDQGVKEGKTESKNRKMKMDEYLSHKKRQFSNFVKNKTSKKQKQRQKEHSNHTSHYIKPDLQVQQKTSLFDITSNQNNKQENFLETLGKNQFSKINKQLPIQTKDSGQKKRKRIQSTKQKQNRLELPQPVKVNQKSINAFLSSKGLNWRILKKINQINGVDSARQNNTISVNFRPRQNSTCLNKGLTQFVQTTQDLLSNTFRVRKFP